MVMEWLKPPETPFTSTVKVAMAAGRLTFSVKELLVDAGLGLKDADTFLGSPEADNVTLPVKPLSRVMVMVDLPLLPRAIVSEFGVADRL
jgi:hypothetical protein